MNITEKKIAEIVSSDWDCLALYHLTPQQAVALLLHPQLFVQEGWLPSRYEFPEHAHNRPQLLLVTRGTVVHIHDKMRYEQKENDLLVVPAKLQHTAFVGAEEAEFYVIVKRAATRD